jgi:hypothetical protein
LGAGLLACQCTRRYYTHGDIRPGYHGAYVCSSRYPKGPGCGSARLWREVVDPAIIEIVEQHVTNQKFLQAIFERVEKTPAPAPRVEREKELVKLAARRKKWMDAYDEDRISREEFNQRVDKVAAAMRTLEAAPPAPPVNIRTVITGLARALARFRASCVAIRSAAGAW